MATKKEALEAVERILDTLVYTKEGKPKSVSAFCHKDAEIISDFIRRLSNSITEIASKL